MTEPILLTPAEAARALGIGRSKLYELLQTGALESVHIGACRRIPADALADLVKRLRDGEDLQPLRLGRPQASRSRISWPPRPR
jgi:excisionase family DNA binding protein